MNQPGRGVGDEPIPDVGQDDHEELRVDEDDLEEILGDDDEVDDAVVPDDYDDDDEEDEDDEDADEDDLDDYEDATPDEVDFVVALYREDGQPVVMSLGAELANDLDELIGQLRRLPGDAGAVAFVSIAQEFFVAVRVRGRTVQVLLNDSVSANDWPIARDVVDYLGLEVPEPDDDSEIVGDLDMLLDQGVSDFDLEAIASDPDEDSDQLVRQLVRKLKFLTQFDKAINEDD